MYVKPLVVQSEVVDIKLLVDHGLHLLVPEDVGGVHVVELQRVWAASLHYVAPVGPDVVVIPAKKSTI